MLLEMMASLYLNECPLLQSGVDPFILFEVGEEETMSCFQVLTLQEQYGDCLEQQVPLDPSIITYDELRYLKVLHFGYDGLFHVGELIVNVKVADEVLDIFKQLYLMRYPIEKLRVMSCYGGSDELSMEDTNSSSFNFRHVTDGGKLSNHAYGLAIDLNPKVNPYVKNDLVLPTNGLAYVNRDQHVLGIIKKNDAVYQLFTSHGWTWGGDWTRLKDYQHFEKKYEKGAISFRDSPFYLRLNNTLSLVICDVVFHVLGSFLS